MSLPIFEIKNSTNKQFYFVLKAENREVILTSETYTEKHNAINGINSVKENSQNVGRFKRLNSSDNQYYFTLHASNGEIIGTSELYTTMHNRDNGIESVIKNAPKAQIE